MNATKVILGAVIVAIALLTLTSIFTIDQGQQAILLRLGRLLKPIKLKF